MTQIATTKGRLARPDGGPESSEGSAERSKLFRCSGVEMAGGVLSGLVLKVPVLPGNVDMPPSGPAPMPKRLIQAAGFTRCGAPIWNLDAHIRRSSFTRSTIPGRGGPLLYTSPALILHARPSVNG